jgi:predicted ATPase
LAALLGQALSVSAMAILSWALIMMGFVDQAPERARAAVALAERLAHLHSHAYALHYAAVAHLERGEHDEAVALSGAALGLSNRYGFQVWGSLSKIVIGQVRARSGRAEEGVIKIRGGIAELQTARVGLGWPTHLLGLAAALKHADRADEALRVLGDALDAVETTIERRAETNTYCFKGELLRSSGVPDVPGAESCYQRALEIARAQYAKLWELRTVTALARWRVSQGRGREALNLLQPVYAWFTEGLDTRDLKEAKALLDTLAATERTGTRPEQEISSTRLGA